MNAYKMKVAYTKMEDPNMNCPGCEDGFLILYGAASATNRPVPTYFQCSNKEGKGGCQHPTIFSKKSGTCLTCQEPVNVGDVITTRWDRNWIHNRCAFKKASTPPEDVFAKCLRCNKNIGSFQDSIPGRVTGIEGFLHKTCGRKRQIDTDETDREHSSSQESAV